MRIWMTGDWAISATSSGSHLQSQHSSLTSSQLVIANYHSTSDDQSICVVCINIMFSASTLLFVDWLYTGPTHLDNSIFSTYAMLTCRMKINKKLSYCLGTARRESLPKIAEMEAEMTFKCTSSLQGHQKWHQSKASVWFPISTLYSRPNLCRITHSLRETWCKTV